MSTYYFLILVNTLLKMVRQDFHGIFEKLLLDNVIVNYKQYLLWSYI